MNNKAKDADQVSATLRDVREMVNMKVPLSVIAQTLNIPISEIAHLKNEQANNDE